MALVAALTGRSIPSGGAEVLTITTIGDRSASAS